MPRRFACAVVALLAASLLTAVASAERVAPQRARVYRAKLVKTDAANVARLPAVRGTALLVDGKKRNTISIHVRGLKRHTSYPWHIHKAKNATGDPCAPNSPAADPTPYGGWTYRTLKANAAGHASAYGRSATFDARTDAGRYYVNVHLLDGTVIACGVLIDKTRQARAG